MLKKIMIVLITLTVLFIGIVARQPQDFEIIRSTIISAPAENIFNQVNNFHNWEHWSPWAKLDPKAQNSFEGPETGVGSIFRWAGNKEVGEGQMTILESRPNELIRIELKFLKPFKATNTAEFTFIPQGNDTAVTWRMYGENNFMAKVMGLFINCDKMVGGMFEKGLSNLKSISEPHP